VAATTSSTGHRQTAALDTAALALTNYVKNVIFFSIETQTISEYEVTKNNVKMGQESQEMGKPEQPFTAKRCHKHY